MRRFLVEDEVTETGDARPWIVYFLMAAVAVGVVARLHAYAYNRGLWLDEGSLVASVIDRRFTELFEPLDYGQLAPIGFLLSMKLATGLFGEGERAFRLFSLLAGLAALPLTFLVARAIDDGRSAWFATALIAVAPSAIYFSTEAKQYAYDILFSLLALWLGLHVLRHALTWRSGAAIALLGGLMVWCSHPVALVLGGIGLTLIVQAIAQRRWRRAGALSAISAVWFVNFVTWILATGSAGRMLGDEDPWATRGFLPLPPHSFGDMAVWARVLLSLPSMTLEDRGGLTEVPLILRMMMLVFVVWVIGLAVLWRKDRRIFAFILLPFVFVLLTSMLEIYPIAARLVVFLLPLLAVPVAMALNWALRWQGDLRFPGMVLALGFLTLPLMHTVVAAARPFPREELRVVLDHVVDHHRPGDVVWLYPRARRTFEYYKRSLAPQTWRDMEIHESDARDLRTQWSELRRFAGQPRVWCIFFHAPASEEEVLIFGLDGVGVRRDSTHAPGASAYLYDLSKT